MLPHCGKCTAATGNVHATIMIPIRLSPVAVEYLELVKNSSCVSPDPKLPPAPVRPEMTPRDLREMKPKVAPQAACAPTEKSIMDVMESGRVVARPRQMQNTPPSVWRIQRRLLIPNLRAAISDISPPSGRDTMLAMPNVAAIVPAV